MKLKSFIGALFAILLSASTVNAQEVLVFAAASTTNALDEIATLFSAKGLGTVKASYASSSTLAKQIEQGAPADVFISADQQWADYLATRNLIDPASRFNLLGNSLVLIAPATSNAPSITIDKNLDFLTLLGEGRLSTGDPDHVPVGIYVKQALETMGQWKAVEPKLARADSVRAALAFVELGETPYGVVYSTDAAVSKKVKIVAYFPRALHDPIVYPAALVAGRNNAAAKAYIEFLKTPAATAIFEKYGFKTN
jgi:molybdate transport system substrate-binding protein